MVGVAEKARKDGSITLDNLKIVLLSRWRDELAKLNSSSIILPTREYYKGYREALMDIMGDLRIKYPRLTYENKYKKSKGIKLKNAK